VAGVNTPSRSPSARSAAAVATALAVVLSSAATLTASATDQATGGAWSSASPRGPRFVDKHGRVLPSPQLYLIYWGAAWQAAPTPTAAQVTGAVRTLLASAYLTGLTQYRGSGHGVLRGSTLVASSDPPAGFTDDQVAEFVDDQITAGTVPGPDADNQTVYGVLMPTGVTPESPGRAVHTYYKRSGQRIHYAWFANAGDLAGITGIVSHELVETATNPEGKGFLGVKGTCGDRSNWCEVADVCESAWSTVDGVTVQGYWSNRDNDCIVPNSVTPEPAAPSQARHPSMHPTTGHAQGETP
jgi:hypothetical protein